MRKSRRNRRNVRKKRNKTIWIISRFMVIAFFFSIMGVFIHGCLLFGNSLFKNVEEDFSQVSIVQNYKAKKEVSNKKNKIESKSNNKKKNNTKEEIDYPSLCELSNVEKPMERSLSEILQRLEELARDNDIIARIYRHNELYSEKLLEALANNPEMADFVEKYLSNNGIENNSLTELEKKQKYPLFLQWDPRWGYAEYGDNSCIGLSGCGPTCLSMVLYYLTGDTKLTPDKIAAYSLENGYYVQGTGTAWALLEDLPSAYHINVRQLSLSEEGMKAELDQNHIIICVMGPGDFTVAGHFIVIYGYDKNGFMINDPNCVARSRKQWKFEEIENQIKNVWTYWL